MFEEGKMLVFNGILFTHKPEHKFQGKVSHESVASMLQASLCCHFVLNVCICVFGIRSWE